MTRDDVVTNGFAMPLTNPSYPRGPYRFVGREYLIITYRTDPDALRTVVPEPLEIGEPIVKYEFIRMPDSTGFGDYTESGQVIPVTYQGVAEGNRHRTGALGERGTLVVDCGGGRSAERPSPCPAHRARWAGQASITVALWLKL